MCATINEDRQRTTTLTDNKKEGENENEGSSMHEDSCIGINNAHAHVFSEGFRTFHTLLGFILCFVSSVQFCRRNHLLNFDLYANSLWSSHCEKGSFEVLSLHTPSVAVVL